jgi:hypothetical protein
VKPKRKILDDDSRHKIQITVHEKQRPDEPSSHVSSPDKFLVQTLSIPRETILIDENKDNETEKDGDVAKRVELRWKQAEKKSREIRKKGHTNSSYDPFRYKYLSTEFEDLEEKPKDIESSTKHLYKEFVSLRRSYEETVADSIEQMAREGRLRNEIAKLKKQLRSTSPATQQQQQQPSSKTTSLTTSPKTSIRPVHLLITSMLFFLLGHVLTLQFEMDLRSWM